MDLEKIREQFTLSGIHQVDKIKDIDLERIMQGFGRIGLAVSESINKVIKAFGVYSKSIFDELENDKIKKLEKIEKRTRKFRVKKKLKNRIKREKINLLNLK